MFDISPPFFKFSGYYIVQCTCWVDFLGDFEGIRSGQVRISRSDSQYERVLSGDELHDHVSDLELNVGRLVSDRDLGQTGKINQCQIEN